MKTARSGLLLTTIAWLACASSGWASEETLDRVKELYLSAAYEEALVVLGQMSKEAGPTSPLELDEYRVLCLIALDRTPEARNAIESMVKTDPMYQLSQASPRVRAMFKEVRQALLPGIVKHTYTEAKAAFDREDPQSAAGFERVLTLLNDPDLADTSTLGDLRTVASAFRDLSKARTSKPAPPPQAAPAAAAANASPAPAAPPKPVVHREGDPGVVAPQVVNQTLPPLVMPSRIQPREAQGWQGILEVLIDETGSVVSARLLVPFHPTYDAQLVKAAMAWKYQPARMDGKPVRFVKHVNVRLNGAN